MTETFTCVTPLHILLPQLFFLFILFILAVHLILLLEKPEFKMGFHICLSLHIVQIHNHSCI